MGGGNRERKLFAANPQADACMHCYVCDVVLLKHLPYKMATAIKPYTEWHHIHAIISVAHAQLRLQFTLRWFQCKTFATQLISVVVDFLSNYRRGCQYDATSFCFQVYVLQYMRSAAII